MSTFFDKLIAASTQNRSLLCVGLDPRPDRVPERFRSAPNPVVAWNQAIVKATSDLVCAYKPNIAFYEAMAPQGLANLMLTLRAIPPSIPVILDAKRGDIGSTAKAYAQAAFEVWGADAVTVSPYLGGDSVRPFTAYADRGVFVLCHTSNPGATELQLLPVRSPVGDGEQDRPLYLEVARLAPTWSEYENVGLVVGATYPEALAAVRGVAPYLWFLVPGVGAQGGDLEAALGAGLRSDGLGVIVNVSRGIALADDPRAAAMAWRDAINRARETLARRTIQPPVASDMGSRLADLTRRLHKLGAIRFGQFTLASGQTSPIYIDLRLLVSDPSLLRATATVYAQLLKDIPYDRLAAVPYAALPIGTAVALTTGKPLIYPRKETKTYGLEHAIEGTYQPGERVVIIEDLVTTGGSTLRTVALLREAGLEVTDVVVLIDREQGAAANLAAEGIQLHAALRLTEMLDTLTASGRIDHHQRDQVLAYLIGKS
ncbi:MAG TPA: orotidine-5'-phosphate decarboxylase [Anaerolineae bacterium]|nr:orotidine-5'-phosphate decarboxylase [Anaerolineae bacterium]HIQ04189.1 orotidine-5'-phosphate decarboxylase [Anaerolineae bacterium]